MAAHNVSSAAMLSSMCCRRKLSSAVPHCHSGESGSDLAGCIVQPRLPQVLQEHRSHVILHGDSCATFCCRDWHQLLAGPGCPPPLQSCLMSSWSTFQVSGGIITFRKAPSLDSLSQSLAAFSQHCQCESLQACSLNACCLAKTIHAKAAPLSLPWLCTVVHIMRDLYSGIRANQCGFS